MLVPELSQAEVDTLSTLQHTLCSAGLIDECLMLATNTALILSILTSIHLIQIFNSNFILSASLIVSLFVQRFQQYDFLFLVVFYGSAFLPFPLQVHYHDVGTVA